MSAAPHFPSAPVVEAIFAIEAPARFPGSPADFKEAARKAVPEDVFPEMQDLFEIGMRFEGDLATGKTQSDFESNWRGVTFFRHRRGQPPILWDFGPGDVERFLPIAGSEKPDFCGS